MIIAPEPHPLTPTSTTCPQAVRMTAFINGSLRSYTYSAQITTA
jgi:hypothetical protein